MSQGDPIGELRGARAKWIKRNVGRIPTKIIFSRSFDAKFVMALAQPSPIHQPISLTTAEGQKFFGMPIEVDPLQTDEILVVGPGLNKSRRRRRYAAEPKPGFEDRTIRLARKTGDEHKTFQAEAGGEAPPLPEGAEEVKPYDASILDAGLVEPEKKKRRRFAGGKEQHGPKA